MDIPTQTEAVVKAREDELLPPTQRGAIRDLCRWAACLSDPLSAERCLSAMLGRMWEDSDRLSWRRRKEWDYALGAPVTREIARIGDSGAVGLLKTLAWLAEQRLEELCVGLLDGLGDIPAPGWSARIGGRVGRSGVTSA